MRGARPDPATMEAFSAAARAQPRPLPLVGHVRHDSTAPGAVYIGRSCYGLVGSKYANPYKLGADGPRAAVVARYEQLAHERLAADPHWLDDLREARVLLCWCRRLGEDDPICHGDVLVKLIAEWRALEWGEQ